MSEGGGEEDEDGRARDGSQMPGAEDCVAEREGDAAADIEGGGRLTGVWRRASKPTWTSTRARKAGGEKGRGEQGGRTGRGTRTRG